MIQTTPEKLRSLRRKLYVKAKAEPDFRIGCPGSGMSFVQGCTSFPGPGAIRCRRVAPGFPDTVVFGELCVIRQSRVHLGPPPCVLR